MSEKKVKQQRRLAKKYAGQIVATSMEKTLDEPWPKRLQTAVYIASGGRMWVARIFTWAVLLLTAWNVYQIVY